VSEVLTVTPERGDPAAGRSSAVRGDHPSRRWWALVVIALAQLMVVLDASIVTIALPFAQRDLNISDANKQWALTAYTLIFGGLLLLGGRLADYLGRRNVFLVGLVGFAAASALGGVAQNQAMFFAGRGLQGAFAALLAPSALSLITVIFTEQKDRAKAFGVYAAVSGGGAALGLIAGGVLTEYLNWRWCLLVNTPIAIAAVVGAFALVHKDRPSIREGGYDVPGAVTATLGLVAVVYGFTRAAEVGWGANSTIGLFVASVVLLGAFVVIELRTPNALLPIAMFAMFLFLSYYFQNTLGYTPLRAGVAFLPFPAGLIVSAGLASALLPRIGPRPQMLFGALAGAAGLLYLAQLDVNSTWAANVLPSELLMAVGMGQAFVAMQSVALHNIAEKDSGVASALLNTAQQVGGSVGLALLSTIVTQVFTRSPGSALIGVDPASHRPIPKDPMAFISAGIHSYDVAFYWGAGFFVLAAAVIMVTIRLRADDLKTDTPVAVVA